MWWFRRYPLGRWCLIHLVKGTRSWIRKPFTYVPISFLWLHDVKLHPKSKAICIPLEQKHDKKIKVTKAKEATWFGRFSPNPASNVTYATYSVANNQSTIIAPPLWPTSREILGHDGSNSQLFPSPSDWWNAPISRVFCIIWITFHRFL